MCEIDKRLVLSTDYSEFGCPSYSIGYYIGLMNGDKECDRITESDLLASMNVSSIYLGPILLALSTLS